MMFGAFTVRVPPDDWQPAGCDPDETKRSKLVTTGDVTAANAIRTPQFWLLWTVLFCNVTAGIGILGQASPMIQDNFATVERRPPPPGSSGCCRSATWAAASSGRRRPT